MTHSNRLLHIALLSGITALLLLFFQQSVFARGSETCQTKSLASASLSSASNQAVKLLSRLNKSDTNIAILARVGGDLSSKGLKYTHAGIAWRKDPFDKWKVTHMLNNCGTANSKIYQQGLLDFFLDDPHSYDSLITIPRKNLADHLLQIVLKKDFEKVLTLKYSMIAYPRSTEFQNSNQWVLETIAVAQGRIRGINIENRLQAQTLLDHNRFKGTYVRIWFLEAVMGGFFKNNVYFRDHTEEEKASGRYEFVSARSITDYLKQTNHLRSAFEITG